MLRPLTQIQFHYAEFRALAQATEDEAKVAQALKLVAGEDAEFAREVQEGHHKNPIIVLTARLARTGDIRKLVARVFDDDALRAKVLGELDGRMDEQANFYMRLAKQDAFLGRLVVATDPGEDPIQVRLKVATYPVRAEVARAKLREFLESLATRKTK